MRVALRALPALLGGLAALALVTGCGGGGAAKPKTHATAPTTTTSSAPGSNLPLGVRLQRGIAACRKTVSSDKFIPATEHAAAAADCEGFKTGNMAPLYAILGPACLAQVHATVPAAKQAASLEACKKAFGTTAG